MTSRVASLLVQEGLVNPKKMADAFQRQVIYGGTLDTILLEMDALDEPLLVDALGRATGFPTAGDLPDVEGLSNAGFTTWFSADVAEKYRAMPISIDGNVLRVMVIDPPDRRQLDELGHRLGQSIDAHIVPEHRFVNAMELLYDKAVPARYQSLAAKLRQRAADPARARRVQMMRRPSPQSRPPSHEIEIDAAPEIVSEERTEPVRPPRQEAAPMAQVSSEVTVQVGGTAVTREATALKGREGIEAIENATDRDAIFETLCRAARAQVSFAALLTVHGDTAAGRVGLGKEWMKRDDLARVSVSLERPSPFRAAAQGRTPYLGRIGEDQLSAEALASMGRKAPVPGVVVPIVLKERPVALLYGDRNGKPMPAEVMSELSQAVAAAGRAFQKMILKLRTQPSMPSPVMQEEERRTLQGIGIFIPPADVLPIDEEPDLGELVQSVATRDGNSLVAADKLLAMGDAGARAVVEALPGPLKIDRHGGAMLQLADEGPLLGLAVRFGAKALPALVERMKDSALEVRYYATRLAGATRAVEAVGALGERLFDADAGVRRAALDALARFPESVELEELREGLRADLAGPKETQQLLAAEAVGRLRDAPSVPRLIELVKHEDAQLAQATRHSLVEITKQDFGSSRWRWRGWWERHRDEHRVEWLLEGLMHADPEVRQASAEELRVLSKESFGYQFDLPKREREEARKRWSDWWRKQGAEKQGQSR